MNESAKKDEKDAIDYKDDPSQFAQSANSVQRGTTSTYSGGGVEETATPVTGMSRGSQEDWQGASADATPTPAEDGGPVDPGRDWKAGPADLEAGKGGASGTDVGGVANSPAAAGAGRDDEGANGEAPNDPKTNDDDSR